MELIPKLGGAEYIGRVPIMKGENLYDFDMWRVFYMCPTCDNKLSITIRSPRNTWDCHKCNKSFPSWNDALITQPVQTNVRFWPTDIGRDLDDSDFQWKG